MDIQAGSGHRADHPRFAQLPALPALPGTGLATGTAPGHCSIQARGAWVPLPGLWQKLRLPWPLVLALLCWIPGNLEISAWIGTLWWQRLSESPSLQQHWWQQGHLTDCGHGCHSRSTSSIHRACRVTESPKAQGFVPCATLWGHSADSPDTRLAPSPDLAVLAAAGGEMSLQQPCKAWSSTACATAG